MDSQNLKTSSETEMQKVGKTVRKVLDTIVGIALYLMVLLIFINAVLRYVFHSGWSFSEEISRWMFVWVTFLGTIVAFVENSHIGVDLVISRLGRKSKFVVSLIGYVMMCASLVLASIGSWRYFMRTYNVPAPASRLPQGVLTVSLLIAMTACLVIAVTKTIKLILIFVQEGKEDK